VSGRRYSSVLCDVKSYTFLGLKRLRQKSGCQPSFKWKQDTETRVDHEKAISAPNVALQCSSAVRVAVPLGYCVEHRRHRRRSSCLQTDRRVGTVLFISRLSAYASREWGQLLVVRCLQFVQQHTHTHTHTHTSVLGTKTNFIYTVPTCLQAYERIKGVL
jgi:hypothetical protein